MTEIEIVEPDAAVAPELVPLSRLRPAIWNPRELKSERFKNLCQSMRDDPDFLKLRPILAMDDGTIYAGNMRYLAAEKMGLERVWAFIGDVADRLARERSLKDNNQWGTWDEDKLGEMLYELQQEGVNVELLGFNDKELQGLLSGDGRALPDPGDQDTDETEHLWGVVVTCTDEAQQVELLERLTQEGFDVRALVS